MIPNDVFIKIPTIANEVKKKLFFCGLILNQTGVVQSTLFL